MVLKDTIFDQKGGQIQNFEEAPLDILEIHVSKFGPIPMNIAACMCYDKQTMTMTNNRHLIPTKLD